MYVRSGLKLENLFLAFWFVLVRFGLFFLFFFSFASRPQFLGDLDFFFFWWWLFYLFASYCCQPFVSDSCGYRSVRIAVVRSRKRDEKTSGPKEGTERQR